jgi:amylosucrase
MHFAEITSFARLRPKPKDFVNTFYPVSSEANVHLVQIRSKVSDRLSKSLPAHQGDLFLLRLQRHFQDLYDGIHSVYGNRDDFAAFVERLVLLMADQYVACPEILKHRHAESMIWPDWFQHESMIGYIAYADRFAEGLKGIESHIDYLSELGVTYLHLMPFLKPRAGENDGGYAVANYREVDPRIGDIDALESLTSKLRKKGIRLVADLVINHVADDHNWAVRARNGEQRYLDYFITFPDRVLPEQYERTLPEVFPATAHGNFTFVPEMGRWVWTTFNNYQWEVNWRNPEVFLEYTDIILFLANKGVEVFRLDAIAFIWKRMGTDCQNQPEVHSITRALRAVARITAPGVIFKAEAIVGPHQLMHYLGTGRYYGKVCDLAYHNSLMVQFWSSLASRDARLMTRALSRFPQKPTNTAWATYIRCHDDIGWAISDEDTAFLGWDGFAHRKFLSEFYSGNFSASFARGGVFQENPQTGDRRISGTTASLAGLEEAIKTRNDKAISLAIERVLLGHALILGYDGIPLIYMGDELGYLNDYNFSDDPDHATDNRWLHRPCMNWEKADYRKVAGSIEHRIFQGLATLIGARKQAPQFHASVPCYVLENGHPHIFTHLRPHPLGNVICVYNFSELPQTLPADFCYYQRIFSPYDLITRRAVQAWDKLVHLAPYERLWIVEASSQQ